MNEELKEYGFDFVWEASGKQLMTKDYCDYAKYLEDQGLYEQYLDFVESAGPNYDTPDMWPEDYCEPFPLEEKHYPDIIIADKAIEKIKEHSGKDTFFLMVSFLSPHKPFDPPKRYLDQIEYEEVDDFIPGDKELNTEQKKRIYVKRRAYKAMIRMIDEQVGKILDTLEENGVLNKTVVIFSSDHGEMLGDHFRIQKQIPWKQSVTVPTAIRHPDFLQNAVNASPVENIDLTATILEIAGLNPKEALAREWPNFNNIVPSRSLLPILEGKVERIREYSFSECNGEWQMLQSEKYKYIRHLKRSHPDELEEELYDLETDRQEEKNLINHPDFQQAIQWCRRRIDYVMDTTPTAQLTWVEL